MCGLAGVLSNYVAQGEYDEFLRLLLVSQFRGRHSTGAFSVTEHLANKGKKDTYQIKYFKQAVPSSSFIENNPEALGQLVEGTDTKLVAGHCRFATKGEINTDNAHPFVFSNVTGMHNGTLSKNIGKPRVKLRKKKDGSTVPIEETDSEAFFRFLNDHTIEEALNEIQDNQSAYAFVWFDKRDNTLNFTRNEKRPLWIAEVGNNTIYWASEKEMLEFILNRNQTGYYQNIKELVNLPTDILVSFDLSAIDPVRTFKVRELKLKKKSFFSNFSGNGGFRGKIPLNQNDKKKQNQKNGHGTNNVISLPRLPSPKSTVPIITQNRKEDSVFYFINKRGFDKKEYEELIQKGCVFCEQQADIRDNVKWLDYLTYLCATCREDKTLDEISPPNFVG